MEREKLDDKEDIDKKPTFQRLREGLTKVREALRIRERNEGIKSNPTHFGGIDASTAALLAMGAIGVGCIILGINGINNGIMMDGSIAAAVGAGIILFGLSIYKLVIDSRHRQQ